MTHLEHAKGPHTRALKALWILAVLTVLAFVIVKRDVHDVGIAMGWLMTILTFPSGFVSFGLCALIYDLTAAVAPGFSLPSVVGNGLIWLAMAAVGYVQWFVLVPWLYRSWSAQRAGRSGGQGHAPPLSGEPRA